MIQTVSDLAAAVGLNSAARLEELKELSRDVTDTRDLTIHAYSDMERQFRHSLEAGGELFAKTLHDINGAAKAAYEELDAAIYGLGTNLVRAAELLATTALEAKGPVRASRGGH